MAAPTVAAAAYPAWSVSTTHPVPVSSLSGVSCVSVTTCEMVGGQSGQFAVAGTTDGGSTWTSQTVPAGAGYLEAVSCGSPTTCEAVGSVGADGPGVALGTTDGGSTWTSQTVPSGVAYLDGISCASATTCEAVGGYGSAVLGTTDGGVTWTRQTVPAGLGQLTSVSCASTTMCETVGNNGSVLGTTDGGSTWTDQTVPAGVTGLYGISCTSDTACEAVGLGVIVGTTDGGATWTSQTVPAGVNGLGALSCTSATVCEAIGYNSSATNVILGTNDGGTTWATQTLPTSISDLLSLSCASASVCEAVGDNYEASGSYTPLVFGTTDEGGTWTAQPAPAGILELNDVSCASATMCEAVGDNYDDVTGTYTPAVFATTDGGVTWTGQRVPTGATTLRGVSCVSSTTCEAVGDNASNIGVALDSNDGGATWSTQSVPAGANGLVAVSCASTTTCEAVGQDSSGSAVALGTADGGSTWNSQSLPAGVQSLEGVSCASLTVCEAVGDGTSVGVILGTTDAGATWNSQSLPAMSFAYALRVSCASASACVAVPGGNPFNPLLYSVPPAPVVASISPAMGSTSGGTSVIITGTDLNGATAVNFGGSAGTITADSSTSITATAPAGSGTVDVTVTTPGGTSAMSGSDQFAYAIQCLAGTYSTTGYTPCTLAPPGTYVDLSGATSAIPCPLGTYNPNSGSMSCTSAPLDTFVNTTGATAPTNCPAGTVTIRAGSTSAGDCVTAASFSATTTCALSGSVTFQPPGLSEGGSLSKNAVVKARAIATPVGTGCSGLPMKLVIPSATALCPATGGVPDPGDVTACLGSTVRQGVTTYYISTKPSYYGTSASFTANGLSNLVAALQATPIKTVIDNVKVALPYGTATRVDPGGACGATDSGFDLTGTATTLGKNPLPVGTYDDLVCFSGDTGTNTTGNFLADLVSPTATIASATVGGNSALTVTVPNEACTVSGLVTFKSPGLSQGGSLTTNTVVKAKSVTTLTGTGCSGVPVKVTIPLATTLCPQTGGIPNPSDPAACLAEKKGVYAIATKPSYYGTSASFTANGLSNLVAALQATPIKTVIDNVKVALPYGTATRVDPGGACGATDSGFDLTGTATTLGKNPLPVGTYDDLVCGSGDTGTNTTGNFLADLVSPTATIASAAVGGASALTFAWNP